MIIYLFIYTQVFTVFGTVTAVTLHNADNGVDMVIVLGKLCYEIIYHFNGVRRCNIYIRNILYFARDFSPFSH